MWHLPIPYKLLLKSNPKKESPFISIDSQIPYLSQNHTKFLEDTRGMFKRISYIDDYSYYESLISNKHLLILDTYNLYDLIFIVINCLLSECIPILYLPNGNILDFLNIDIPKDAYIILERLDAELLRKIDDDMVFSKKLPICKMFKQRFIKHEISKVEGRLSRGLTVYYLQTTNDTSYLDNLRYIIGDLPKNINIMRIDPLLVLDTISIIYNNHRGSDYILVLSDYKQCGLYKEINLSFYLDILREYKVDCIHLFKTHDGLDVLRKGDYNIAKCCYNPIHKDLPGDIVKYNKCCHYEHSNNTVTSDYSPYPGFNFLNCIYPITLLRQYIGNINTLIDNYNICEFDYALRYYKKGFRTFYLY